MAADDAGGPRWLYFVGAAGIFVLLSAAPGLLDNASKPVSDVIVDGVNDLQTTTTSTTTTSTVP